MNPKAQRSSPHLPFSAPAISLEQRLRRLARLRTLMDERRVGAVLLGSTTSLRYFTGLRWTPSERLVGAVVTAKSLDYISPRFELEKIQGEPILAGGYRTWEEEESPYALVREVVGDRGLLAVDDQLPLFAYRQLAMIFGHDQLVDAGPLTNALRRCKEPGEIALMSAAKAMTLEVHRRAHRLLRRGIRASEVVRYIDEQHRAFGAEGGSSFCIVSFGPDTGLPHGGATDRELQDDEAVLIDTGGRFDGYSSDITRSYVFGEPTKEYRRIWELEREAQAAAFDAARLGVPCEAVDAAARGVVASAGLGPDYQLPGIPHRTGHGIGLDIHESPNLVRGDHTPLEVGMCFSNEPMIVVPGRFGVRLEDHFHMTAAGPKWFTLPQPSLDEPFAGVTEVSVSSA